MAVLMVMSTFGLNLHPASGLLNSQASRAAFWWRVNVRSLQVCEFFSAQWSPLQNWKTVTWVFPGSACSTQGSCQTLPMFHLLVLTKPENSFTGAIAGFTKLLIAGLPNPSNHCPLLSISTALKSLFHLFCLTWYFFLAEESI